MRRYTSGGVNARREKPRGSSNELPSRSRGTNVTVARAGALSGYYHANKRRPTRQMAFADRAGPGPTLFTLKRLLHFYASTRVGEFLLDSLGLFLIDAFLDGLGCAVHQV